MSERAFRLALTIPFPPEHAASKFVLALLAWHHNEDEGLARPSVAKVAAEASLTIRQAQRHLRWLVAAGGVTITRRRRKNGTQTSSAYAFPWLPPPADEPHGARARRNGAPAPAHRVTPASSSQSDAGVTQQSDADVAPSPESGVTQTSPLERHLEERHSFERHLLYSGEARVAPPLASLREVARSPSSSSRSLRDAGETPPTAAPDQPLPGLERISPEQEAVLRRAVGAIGAAQALPTPDELEAKRRQALAQLAAYEARRAG